MCLIRAELYQAYKVLYGLLTYYVCLNIFVYPNTIDWDIRSVYMN